jgi:alginate O-acetyltransferase complex protein AlgI
MLFNSSEFLLFFPLVTIIYFLLPHKFRWIHLLIASCIFYMAFIPVYILILVFTIVVDYIAGIWIARSVGKRRKWFLVLSLIANIGILAVFKYYNFFIENINEILHYLGIHSNSDLPYLNIILPIGLSFHTFQAMSYTIEVYRGNQKPERHFGIYALYVMFYPQLVAGPIERPQHLLPQLREKHQFDIDRVYAGLRLMLWGLFKKVVIADRLALYVNEVYGNVHGYGSGNLLIAVFFFAIQIYCDFSGYSDMALGAARVMGFTLMTNFNRPYFSRNIREFWQRWHISLSSWFRDYLYKSLGGNRISPLRTYINILIVFLISGFWHGANYTFVVWGAIHGILVILFIQFKKYNSASLFDKRFIDPPSVLLTFVLVSLAFVFFRANSVNDAMYVLGKIFNFDFSDFTFMLKDVGNRVKVGKTSLVIAAFSIILLFINDRYQRIDQSGFDKKPFQDILYNAFILFLVIVFGVFKNTNFIYFQF